MKMQGVRCSQRELGEFFGVSATTIRNWVNAGCPVFERGSRGNPHVFDSAAVFEWRMSEIQRDADSKTPGRNFEAARARAVAARAGIMEMNLAQRRGELVEVAEAAAIVAKEYAIVRAGFISLPKIAPRLAFKKIPEIEELLADRVNEILTELSEDAARQRPATDDAADD